MLVHQRVKDVKTILEKLPKSKSHPCFSDVATGCDVTRKTGQTCQNSTQYMNGSLKVHIKHVIQQCFSQSSTPNSDATLT